MRVSSTSRKLPYMIPATAVPRAIPRFLKSTLTLAATDAWHLSTLAMTILWLDGLKKPIPAPMTAEYIPLTHLKLNHKSYLLHVFFNHRD